MADMTLFERVHLPSFAGATEYQLVRQHDAVRDRTLEITFLAPGAEAYSFTFG